MTGSAKKNKRPKRILYKRLKRRVFLFAKKMHKKFRHAVKAIVFNIPVRKTAALILVLGLAVQAGFVSIRQTSAYFNDIELGAAQELVAGTLDLNLNSSAIYSSPFLYPGDSNTASVTVMNGGSLPYSYKAEIKTVTAANEPCDYIEIIASDGVNNYNEALLDFISDPVNIASGDSAAWSFNFSLATNTPSSVWGEVCFFKWSFTAWQQTMPDNSLGFTDVQEKLGTIRIGKAVVLNEVLPNPLGTDNAHAPGGEWVELYNNSSSDIDLKSWFIYDSTDSGELDINPSRTDTHGTVIPAHGFLVVYRDHDTDFNLNNDGDTVRLYNARISKGGQLIDSFTYTEEKPEGFSFARIPDGTGDWVDPVPTPGSTNVIDEDLAGDQPSAVSIEKESLMANQNNTPEEVGIEESGFGDNTQEALENIENSGVPASSGGNNEEFDTENEVSEEILAKEDDEELTESQSEDNVDVADEEEILNIEQEEQSREAQEPGQEEVGNDSGAVLAEGSDKEFMSEQELPEPEPLPEPSEEPEIAGEEPVADVAMPEPEEKIVSPVVDQSPAIEPEAPTEGGGDEE